MRYYWDIEDPAAFQGTEEEKLAKFREIRDKRMVERKRHLRKLNGQVVTLCYKKAISLNLIEGVNSIVASVATFTNVFNEQKIVPSTRSLNLLG